MKSNTGKCILLGSTNNTVNIKTDNINITNSTCEKLLGVRFDHKLAFDDLISELCKKASRKHDAVAKVIQYINIPNKLKL